MANNNSWLTTAGESLIVNALASTTPFNIDSWKVGTTDNLAVDQSLTDVVGTVVDSGTVAEMEFDVISQDNIIIRVILSESKGPYQVGNVGLFNGTTLVAIGSFEVSREKTPNAVGVIGNRLVISIPINFVDVQAAINFNVYTNTFSSWPFVQTIAELPAPNLAPFEGYIVREDPSQNRPITAIRNEEPSGSGNFVWTFDYHNSITGPASSLNDSYQINISTGDHSIFKGGTELARVDGNLRLLNNSKLRLTDGTALLPSLTFDSETNLGLRKSGAGSFSFISGGSDIAEINSLSLTMLNSSKLRLTDGTELLPAAAFTSDPDTGLRLAAAGDLRLVVGGADRIGITTTSLQLLNGTTFTFSDGTEALPGIAFTSEPSSGLSRSVSGDYRFLNFSLQGIGVGNFSRHPTLYPNGIMQLDNGSSSYPAYGFDNSGIGMWSTGSGVLCLQGGTTPLSNLEYISLRAAGTESARVDRLGFKAVFDSSNNKPPYSFLNEDDMGMYRSSAGILGFTVDSTSSTRRDLILGSSSLSIGTSVLGLTSANGIFSSVIAAGSTTGGEFWTSRNDTAVGLGDFVGAYLFRNTDASGVTPHYAGIASYVLNTSGDMDLRFYVGSSDYENDDPSLVLNNTNLTYTLNSTNRFIVGSTSSSIYVHDFLIGHETRRGTPGRALVDNTTELGLNWAGDWPSVRVQSSMNIDGNLQLVNTNNPTINVISNSDAGQASVNIYGSGQSTGKLYVGQSDTVGGGIEYNGDDIPSTSGGGPDTVAFYRRTSGIDTWTARYSAFVNTWEFRSLKVGFDTGGGSAVDRIDNISKIFAGYCPANAVGENVPIGMSISNPSAGIYRLTHGLGALSVGSFSFTATTLGTAVGGTHVELVGVGGGVGTEYIEYRIRDSSDSGGQIVNDAHSFMLVIL